MVSSALPADPAAFYALLQQGADLSLHGAVIIRDALRWGRGTTCLLLANDAIIQICPVIPEVPAPVIHWLHVNIRLRNISFIIPVGKVEGFSRKPFKDRISIKVVSPEPEVVSFIGLVMPESVHGLIQEVPLCLRVDVRHIGAIARAQLLSGEEVVGSGVEAVVVAFAAVPKNLIRATEFRSLSCEDS